jgi:2-C-methyl-D-erythritol 2,4-cyclodiphosphate synthase
MSPPEFRVGLGHDTHLLVPGRPLMLGGVPIPFEQGLDGHSDADILLHALTDALLGAAGLGDIGEWFPNTDDRWKGADSQVFLAEALRGVGEAGWRPGNVDCTIFAERPRLSEHKPAIRRRLAELLGLDESAVNVKAKSGERVGPVGRGEAMTADAVVLVYRTRAE